MSTRNCCTSPFLRCWLVVQLLLRHDGLVHEFFVKMILSWAMTLTGKESVKRDGLNKLLLSRTIFREHFDDLASTRAFDGLNVSACNGAGRGAL